MASLFDTKDVFTFTWQIDNFSMCAQKQGEFLTSPVFVVDGLQKSSWELQLLPRGDNEYISVYLRRCGPVQHCESKIPLKYTLGLYGQYPSKHPSKADITYQYAIGDSYGFPKLEKRKEILKDIPGDVLTVRCCMWLQYMKDNKGEEILEDEKNCAELSLSLDNIKNLDGMKEMLCATKQDLAAFKYRFSPSECFARTQIKVERMSIVCPFANVCKDESEKRSFLPIMSAMSSPSFILIFEKSDIDDLMIIKIQRIADKNSQHFVTGKITAFNSGMSSVHFEEDEYLFEAGEESDYWPFTRFIKTNTTNELILSCEFAISTRGNENHTYQENKIVVDWKTNQLNINTFGDLGNIFRDFYKCPNLTDVVLTCDNHIYHVHKSVLLTTSKRFIALLKDENSLNIKDLKPNILNVMLKFMYHVEIPDMKEKASDLYFAAQTYEVESLKQECSSILKSELSVLNVCNILTMADEYKDLDLFSAVQNFIYNNAKDVFESSEWLDLSEKNPKLALNMSQRIIKQNMKM